MTRWARSGSSQKHKKMPGAPTPWSELSHQDQKSLPQNQKKRKQFVNHQEPSNNIQGSSDIFVIDNNPPKKRKKERKIEIKEESKAEELKKSPTKKNKKKKKFTKLHTSESDSAHFENSEGGNPIKSSQSDSDKPEKSEEGSSSVNVPQNKVFENKRSRYLGNLMKRRKDKGILLLPAKIERKLYNIRKKLHDNGMPPQIIKEILRKERRKAELNFRKTFKQQCFNCRKMGHVYADCLEKSSSSVKQKTGICFKCGSEEHTSYKCSSGLPGYPFAKCFICKEQGHITKDCPKNDHGIYPKGGCCNLCGNVNHLRKDCPTLKRKKEEEAPITLHTISEATSVDAEVVDQRRAAKKKKVQKPKVVKF